MKSKAIAFSDPSEICAIGKHPEGRVRLTTQLPVTSQEAEEPEKSASFYGRILPRGSQ